MTEAQAQAEGGGREAGGGVCVSVRVGPGVGGVGKGIGATVCSLSANPTDAGAEGTSVFGMVARVPTQAISSLVPALRLPAVAVVAPCQGCHPAAHGWFPNY